MVRGSRRDLRLCKEGDTPEGMEEDLRRERMVMQIDKQDLYPTEQPMEGDTNLTDVMNLDLQRCRQRNFKEDETIDYAYTVDNLVMAIPPVR